MGAFRSRARMNAASTTSSKRTLALGKAPTANNRSSSRAPASSKPVLTNVPITKNGSSSRASTNGAPKAAAAMPAVREERLQKVLELIESGQPCTIHAMAQAVNLSHSHLQHLFKQQTGVCLGQLLTEQKLHRAAYLLTHSNLRIKEIANSTGYEHTSSFIRAFERHFAQPPRLYRKSQARTKS
jgi:transcriptional regulator GlxA family with amidase domain